LKFQQAEFKYKPHGISFSESCSDAFGRTRRGTDGRTRRR